jgi:hypothetical protein
LIIACVGGISKLQLYICSSYGLLAELKNLHTVQSSLFRSLCTRPPNSSRLVALQLCYTCQGMSCREKQFLGERQLPFSFRQQPGLRSTFKERHSVAKMRVFCRSPFHSPNGERELQVATRLENLPHCASSDDRLAHERISWVPLGS